MKRIRVGVMGCGAVADYGHIASIRATEGLKLAALFDPNEVRLRQVASKHGNPPAFTSQGDFMSQDLDVVVVASPAGAHLENVLACAARGLPVLCEKPIAASDEDAEVMIEAMASRNLPFAIGYVYRFSDVALQIRAWIQKGLVGEVRSLRLIYVWDLHGQYEVGQDGKWIISPRWEGRMLEGGPMVDCGVHQIDLARWWLQSEVANWQVSAAWVAEYEAPDHVYLHMDMETGAHVMVEMSFTYGHTAKNPAPLFSYDIIGTGGVIRYDRNGWSLECRDGQGIVKGQGASEKNFDGMYRALRDAVRSNNWSGLPTAVDGLAATKLATEATEAAIARRCPPLTLRQLR